MSPLFRALSQFLLALFDPNHVSVFLHREKTESSNSRAICEDTAASYIENFDEKWTLFDSLRRIAHPSSLQRLSPNTFKARTLNNRTNIQLTKEDYSSKRNF